MVEVGQYKEAKANGSILCIDNDGVPDLLIFSRRIDSSHLTDAELKKHSQSCAQTIERIRELNPISVVKAGCVIVDDLGNTHAKSALGGYTVVRLDPNTHKPTVDSLDREYKIKVQKYDESYNFGDFTAAFRAIFDQLPIINENDGIMDPKHKFQIDLPNYKNLSGIWKFRAKDNQIYIGQLSWQYRCIDGVDSLQKAFATRTSSL